MGIIPVSITQDEAVEMLSQHIITKPVFEALFEGYSFVKNNPVSVSMQAMLPAGSAEPRPGRRDAPKILRIGAQTGGWH